MKLMILQLMKLTILQLMKLMISFRNFYPLAALIALAIEDSPPKGRTISQPNRKICVERLVTQPIPMAVLHVIASTPTNMQRRSLKEQGEAPTMSSAPSFPSA